MSRPAKNTWRDIIAPAFNDRLKEFDSVRQLATTAGVSPETIEKVSHGEKVRHDALRRLATAIGWERDAFERMEGGADPKDVVAPPSASSVVDPVVLAAEVSELRAEVRRLSAKLDELGSLG